LAPLCPIQAATNIYLTNTSSLTYVGTGKYFGNGSVTNPYWGDFDAILTQKTAAGNQITLRPGAFYTLGINLNAVGLNLKANQLLLGSGKSSTFVRLASLTTCNTLGSTNNGVTIKDLTVDCNPNETYSDAAIRGVRLTGNNCWVQDVNVVHANGCSTNSNETFAIFVGSPGTVGNYVYGCIVSNFCGDYFAGINFQGGGTVENNSVILPTFSTNMIGTTGYQPNNTDGAVFTNNYCSGGRASVYCDSYPNTNLSFVSNNFEGALYGLCMGSMNQDVWWDLTISNLVINGNTIFVDTDLPIFGVWTRGAPITIRNMAGPTGTNTTIDNVTIESNNLGFQGSGSTSQVWESIDLLTDPWYTNSTKGQHYFYNGVIKSNGIMTNVPNHVVSDNLGMQYWTFTNNTVYGTDYPLGLPQFPAAGSYTNTKFQYP
jgi:hypothetical protein